MTTVTAMVNQAEQAVDAILRDVGKDIVLGLPLGLGKPVRLVNALYQRARRDRSVRLHIVTALSLVPPVPSSSLEKRFLTPFLERLYGDQPELTYARDLQAGKLPDNVTVSEFFFKAGDYLGSPAQQQRYVCTNYTHAVRDLMAQGVNVIAQMVAPPREPGGHLSLSCNPDLTLDLLPLLDRKRDDGEAVLKVAEYNSYLPWLGHQGALPESAFNLVLSSPDTDYPLFPVPQTAITPADHLIGFYASCLIRDGGTLQVGIGSLGAAVVHSVLLRHQHNPVWQTLYRHLSVDRNYPELTGLGGTEPFRDGLYGCSEMMVDGFLHLLKAGVLKRRVYDDPDAQARADRGELLAEDSGVVMHGGFYLGPAEFYQMLRDLPQEQRQQIAMTSVNYINDLYDHRFGRQALKVAQRRHARFINSAMMQTLSGAAVSDGLEDGRVISGVGGQYNFVAMAHELPCARSILTLNSTRESGGQTLSNIVFSYGHCTIPRHLRDIVITEYGIADLRGKTDEDVYLALIRIADSRFQSGLLRTAQAAGKIRKSFRLPAAWRRNTPEFVKAAIRAAGESHFSAFPFGCAFTDTELDLGKALNWLQAQTAGGHGKLRVFWRALTADTGDRAMEPYLRRMELLDARSPRARLDRRLVAVGLQGSGVLASKPSEMTSKRS